MKCKSILDDNNKVITMENIFIFQIIKMPQWQPETSPNIIVDKAELRDRLTPIEYQVTQEKGTEK